MADLSFEFPDGSIKEFADAVVGEDIAKSISISLAKKAVAAKVDGKLHSINEPLHKGGKLEIVTKDSVEGLTVLRQTAAQILKMAIAQDFKNIQFGESVADVDGFYVDTDKPDTQITVDELDGLADSMKKSFQITWKSIR
ncbi:threonyl-tRNA synthetase [Lentilactobacillus kosonis]|uniref:Threonyl-tRNA synthetase n=1 Tax=Lentilactobacillus kosonis TaxID=2810561 RepID=A0A401FKN8_9LACO|nr:threonyl-tRNA synthetase [Lentilactobacillus kosonis]